MVIILDKDQVLGEPCPDGYSAVHGKEVLDGRHTLVLVDSKGEPMPQEYEDEVRKNCEEDGVEPECVSCFHYKEARNFGTSLSKGDLVKCIIYRQKHHTLFTFHGSVVDFMTLANGTKMTVVSYPNTRGHVPSHFRYNIGSADYCVYLGVRRIASETPNTQSMSSVDTAQLGSTAPSSLPSQQSQPSASATTWSANNTNSVASSAASWTNSNASWDMTQSSVQANPTTPPVPAVPQQQAPQSPPTGSGSAQEPQPPQARGDFVIFMADVLGSGGFGTVYKAFQQSTGNTCACKMLHKADATASIKEMQEEAELLSSMHHENIVQLTGFDLAHPPCLFMEWVPSGSISGLLQKLCGCPLSPPVISKYLRQVLQGLAYLHKHNVVHRDIKPANILITDKGVAKLSDFGLCKQIASKGSTSAVMGGGGGGGSVAGSIPYLSPEAVHGHQGRASDVWAIGCVALEMATGQVPWSHASHLKNNAMALLFAIGSGKEGEHHPPLPGAMDPKMATFISRCFTFDAKERPSCEALLEDPFFVQ